ncbi:hypothetical protein [Piscirickettsia salmonis]|nr:hypothetical protein [Piscirickettsia salmonis]QIX56676.1 hypothetical protein GW536_16010 [Piscirickettsia salmonis]QNR80337.1 hypothetical protein ICC15_15755 [Piscirickettsia salmonis]
MLGDFASLDVQNTYRGSDAYGLFLCLLEEEEKKSLSKEHLVVFYL